MSLELIKKLREETSAGMLECKKALEQANGDYESAKVIIEKTVQKTNESKRVASKGLCHVVTRDNEAILFEVNAETDFVSKNEHFKELITKMGEVLIESHATYPKEALKVNMGTKTVDEAIQYTSGIIKENAYLRRFFRIKKQDHQSFGTYIHQGGKVVTLVVLNTNHQELAKDLAMQVAANPPTYLSLDTIDSQTRLYEKMMLEKKDQPSDEEAVLTHLRSLTLYDQMFIKESHTTVFEMVKNNQSEVVDFFRFELGQGIEDKLSCKLNLPCEGSIIEIK
ncbi:MAG: translation elongation factor Ts [Acholeplasmataceae bacterium]|jgi:elongation factor Ts|nr:translation elongation factor Ts [Acholeplasmataceae bacterium]